MLETNTEVYCYRRHDGRQFIAVVEENYYFSNYRIFSITATLNKLGQMHGDRLSNTYIKD